MTRAAAGTGTAARACTAAGPPGLLTPAATWPAHLRVHGELPAGSAADILACADHGAVLGRGGGGFPLAVKLRAAAEHGRGTVIANCTESEPASRKDAVLLATAPHLVVDGALLAARAVRARRVLLAVHAGESARLLRSALAERDDTGDMELLEAPPRYVAGEASALVRLSRGGPALPTHRTAPLARGRRPQLVQNAETLACLALLARGWPADSLLVTVRGAVPRTAVLEVPPSTTIGGALEAAGGTVVPIQAVLVGGYAGRWLRGSEALDIPLSRDGLRQAGGTLGAGLVVAFPAGDCGLAATAEVLTYLAGQGARQCGPCLLGLPTMSADLHDLAAGVAPAATLERLERWCALVRGRGACSHPDGAAVLVASALEVFAEDVDRHLQVACGRPAGTSLAVPR